MDARIWRDFMRSIPSPVGNLVGFPYASFNQATGCIYNEVHQQDGSNFQFAMLSKNVSKMRSRQEKQEGTRRKLHLQDKNKNITSAASESTALPLTAASSNHENNPNLSHEDVKDLENKIDAAKSKTKEEKKKARLDQFKDKEPRPPGRPKTSTEKKAASKPKPTATRAKQPKKDMSEDSLSDDENLESEEPDTSPQSAASEEEEEPPTDVLEKHETKKTSKPPKGKAGDTLSRLSRKDFLRQPHHVDAKPKEDQPNDGSKRRPALRKPNAPAESKKGTRTAHVEEDSKNAEKIMKPTRAERNKHAENHRHDKSNKHGDQDIEKGRPIENTCSDAHENKRRRTEKTERAETKMEQKAEKAEQKQKKIDQKEKEKVDAHKPEKVEKAEQKQKQKKIEQKEKEKVDAHKPEKAPKAEQKQKKIEQKEKEKVDAHKPEKAPKAEQKPEKIEQKEKEKGRKMDKTEKDETPTCEKAEQKRRKSDKKEREKGEKAEKIGQKPRNSEQKEKMEKEKLETRITHQKKIEQKEKDQIDVPAEKRKRLRKLEVDEHSSEAEKAGNIQRRKHIDIETSEDGEKREDLRTRLAKRAKTTTTVHPAADDQKTESISSGSKDDIKLENGRSNSDTEQHDDDDQLDHKNSEDKRAAPKTKAGCSRKNCQAAKTKKIIWKRSFGLPFGERFGLRFGVSKAHFMWQVLCRQCHYPGQFVGHHHSLTDV